MSHEPSSSQPPAYRVRIGAKGRVVLPAPLRARLELEEGDDLVLTVEPEGGFRAEAGRDAFRRLRGSLKGAIPGRSLAEELIAERREEARRAEDGR